MSEYINNRQLRREQLKDMIRQLHQGANPAELKLAFRDILQDVGASEIGTLESELIAEGLPETEIQRLCDVHVAVFEDALVEQPKPETVPGHPVHTFGAENDALAVVAEQVKAAAGRLYAAASLDEARQALLALEPALLQLKQVEKHYLREEHLLFPYLEKHGFKGPSTVMWALHDEVRACFRKLLALGEGLAGYDLTTLKRAVAEALNPALEKIVGLIGKETSILFPMSLEKLSAEEWQAIKEQSGEIGYALIQPADHWTHKSSDEAQPAPNLAQIAAGALIPLSVGALSLGLLDLMLKTLPIDITVVDKDNRVAYFSQGKDRLFVRTEAIIGRLVQNCHPPASIDRVNRILEDFKLGRSDVAEFWIQMHGRFAHIRYFALRDAKGEYAGCLEVTQDVTQIRQLQGERRLLAA